MPLHQVVRLELLLLVGHHPGHLEHEPGPWGLHRRAAGVVWVRRCEAHGGSLWRWGSALGMVRWWEAAAASAAGDVELRLVWVRTRAVTEGFVLLLLLLLCCDGGVQGRGLVCRDG